MASSSSSRHPVWRLMKRSSSTAAAVVLSFLLVCCLLMTVTVVHGHAHQREDEKEDESSGPTWVVVVSTSRYWHNYRHSANALSLYRLCKMHGIRDDHILLFLGDNVACDPRNDDPGFVFGDAKRTTNLYGCDVRPDFTGYEADLQHFLQAMQSRYTEEAAIPLSRRLLSGNNSNVLFYITGHGGDGFMKFQDAEFLTSEDIGETISILHTQGRYRNMLVLAETCQAASLCKDIRSPNVVCVASSHVGQDSYSHHADSRLGVFVIDKFSYEMLKHVGGFQQGGGGGGGHPYHHTHANKKINNNENRRMCNGHDHPSLGLSLRSFFKRFETKPSAIAIKSNPPHLVETLKVRDFFCKGRGNGDSSGHRHHTMRGTEVLIRDVEELL